MRLDLNDGKSRWDARTTVAHQSSNKAKRQQKKSEMTVRQFLVFLLLLVACYSALGAPKKKSKTSSSSSSSTSSSSASSSSSVAKKEEDAMKRLQVLADKLTQSPMLSLTDNNFTKFVVDRPRNYRAILMFTATDPKYQCSVCAKVKNNFEEIAKMYNSQFNFSEVPVEEKIVFFRLEVDGSRGIFGELGLETVPRMYLLPAASASSPKQNFDELEFDSRPFMEGVSAALEHVNAASNINIRVFWNPMPILLGMGMLALLMALFVSTASYDVSKAFLFYQSSKIWVLFSLICFGVGVSGSIYCVIRSAPPFGYTRQGTLSIFAAQGREQFLIEGVIVALWTIGSGIAYYMLYFFSKVKFPLVRHLGVLFSMTLFVVLALQLWGAYGLKTQWYSLRETLPAEVWQFLRASVKKDSNIVKRFLRLSELWLTEVKDLEGMKKKFELLIVDYLKRLVSN